MHTKRSVTLALSFLVLSLPVFAQQVIATVPVGIYPQGVAANPTTNKTYAVNSCGADPNCASVGTVTEIDGVTFNTRTVTVQYYPDSVAVNPVTNKIYVANSCGNDPNCASNGTVSVIDGASFTVTNTVTAESFPYGVAVNSTTNKIYVVNVCGADLTCQTLSGTVTAIDGATLNTVSVAIGANPYNPVVDPLTNKIYVPNACGTDPTCATFNGTLSVIDGPTNNVTSVNVGISPTAADVDTSSNMIYVANECGDDSSCASTATITKVDGGSLTTTDVSVGGYYPFAIAVDSTRHKIYVPDTCYGDPSCNSEPYGTVSVVDGGTLAYRSVPAGDGDQSIAINSTLNKIYVVNSCAVDHCVSNATVTVIDGATLNTANVGVGLDALGVAINSTTNRIYVSNYLDDTTSVIDGTPPTALQFVPLAQPCRAVDTRPQYGGNGPIQGGTSQNFSISGSPACGTLPSAAAYSMNVTVVPQGTLGYLTIWPTGQPQPLASTLNSVDGRVKADAAITQAGTSGQVSVYVTNTTDVIIDVNGYFTPPVPSTLAFYPLPPCRVADTRTGMYQGLGPPSLTHGMERDFPILNATGCNIPSTAAAYSLNFTVVPPGPLGYLTVWPTGQSKPTVSTLNDVGGLVIANAAIVVAGTGMGSPIAVYPSDNTDLVIDINGYFAAAGPGGLSFYGLTPCRVLDTRKVGTGQPFSGTLTPAVDVLNAGCSALSTSQGYVFNATVVPMGSLGYLTLWPDGEIQPVVSTLNATDGSITNNMAIVPTNPMTTTGIIDAYAGNGITQLILDLSGYFAP